MRVGRNRRGHLREIESEVRKAERFVGPNHECAENPFDESFRLFPCRGRGSGERDGNPVREGAPASDETEIVHAAMAEPTEACVKLVEAYIRPLTETLRAIVRDLFQMHGIEDNAANWNRLRRRRKSI
jgi:hypothetical protein